MVVPPDVLCFVIVVAHSDGGVSCWYCTLIMLMRHACWLLRLNGDVVVDSVLPVPSPAVRWVRLVLVI